MTNRVHGPFKLAADTARDPAGRPIAYVTGHFSVSGATCKIRLVFRDSRGKVAHQSDERDLEATETRAGPGAQGAYLSECEVFDLHGEEFRIVVTEAVSSGSVEFVVSEVSSS